MELKDYGTVNYEGHAYQLITEPSEASSFWPDPRMIYEAFAIRKDEEPEDGYRDAYEITWELLDGWDGEDGAEACDWDNPDRVKPGYGIRPNGTIF